MRRTGNFAGLRAVLAGTALTALLAGCAQGGAGLDVSAATTQPSFSASASPSPSPSPTATAPIVTATTPLPVPVVKPEAPWVVVNLGSWAKDPAAQALPRYGDARTRAAIAHDPSLPAFVAITTGQWRTFQASEFAKSKKNGWTVPKPAKYAVLGVTRTGGRARVKVCMWDPSTNYRVVRTGAWAEKTTNVWSAYDFRLALTTTGWKVDNVYAGKFSCAGAR